MSGVTADAIEKLLDISRAEIVTVGDRPYSSKKLYEVLDPTPAPLKISTLTGLADYLNSNPDDLVLTELVIEVTSHDSVKLFSTIDGKFSQRATFLLTTVSLDVFPFGRYLDLESFIISLQCKFVQTEMTALLLRLAGNVTGESVANFNDDGVTQKVTARAGVVRVEDVQVPNPVTLAPFRTFLELDQPESKFVYRLKQDGGNGIHCALLEADGGNWKLEAIKRIRDYLRVHCPEDVTILA